MSMALVSSLGTGLVVVAVAGWWIRRLWNHHVDRSLRVRKSAERERANDLRDCRLAHESLLPDRSEVDPVLPSRGPGPFGAEASPERRRAEERWRRAHSVFDPDLPAERGAGS
jgi:hypothetical protein